MNGAEFREALRKARKDLDDVVSAVAQCRAKGTLSEESYRFFESFSLLCSQLDDAISLIDAREVALAAVEVLVTMRVKDTPDKVLFGGLAVTFKVARYLGLQVYASTGWALYDSLAKVAGILCCVDERSKNEAKPVKLPEDFLKEKKWVGARVRDHLKGGYGWPIGVSYAIRNWLVHDGHSQNGFPLFKYESPDLGPFEIANEAWKKIEEKCTSYGVSSVDTRLRPFPDVKGDVLNGLKSCNAEVDEAMSFLILWSVNGVKRQAELLFARDNA